MSSNSASGLSTEIIKASAFNGIFCSLKNSGLPLIKKTQ